MPYPENSTRAAHRRSPTGAPVAGGDGTPSSSARYPIARLSAEYAAELRPCNAGGDDMARICERAEDLTVIVAGGPGKHSSWQPTFGGFTRPVTRIIAG